MDPDRKRSKSPCRLEGRYANFFAVGYNEYEFVIDFGQSYSESDQPEMCTRIVTGPVYAKTFLKMLQDSIATFEVTYGRIDEEDPQDSEP